MLPWWFRNQGSRTLPWGLLYVTFSDVLACLRASRVHHLLLVSHTPKLHKCTIASWALGLGLLDRLQMPIRSWREQLNNLAMLLSCSFLQVLSALLDSPWPNSLLWGFQAVRRIIVSRAILSLISTPCRARESVAAVRRILVISPESSHHQRKAILLFARVQMCGHLPLFCSAYAKKPIKYTRHLLGRSVFFLSWCYFHLLANMTWSTTSLGLVGVQTPFNPMKFLWVERRFQCNPFVTILWYL
jgi:hypothetical protein